MTISTTLMTVCASLVITAAPQPKEGPASPSATAEKDGTAEAGADAPDDAKPGEDDSDPADGGDSDTGTDPLAADLDAAPGAEETPSIRVLEGQDVPPVLRQPPFPEDSAVEPAPIVRQRRVYPDIPIKVRFEMALAFASSINHNTSYLGFETDRNFNALDVGMRLDFPLGKRVFLGPVVGYRRSTADGHTYQSVYDTELALHEPNLGVRLSVLPVDFVDIYLQAAGGPGIADMNFYWEGGDAEQRAVIGGGTAYAGAMVYLPKRALPRRGSSRATVGIDFGVGYALRGAIDVEPKRSLDDEPIATEGTEMGSLKLSGVTWRLGMFVRFN